MVRLVYIFFALFASAGGSAIFAATADLEAWFREYAHVWHRLEESDVGKITDYFAFPHYKVPRDGTEPVLYESALQAKEFYRTFVRSVENWTGNALTALKVHHLSDQAAIVEAQWQDYDLERQLGEDCYGFTYMVARFGTQWRITGVVSRACEP